MAQNHNTWEKFQRTTMGNGVFYLGVYWRNLPESEKVGWSKEILKEQVQALVEKGTMGVGPGGRGYFWVDSPVSSPLPSSPPPSSAEFSSPPPPQEVRTTSHEFPGRDTNLPPIFAAHPQNRCDHPRNTGCP